MATPLHRDGMASLSVVVPCYNEEDALPIFIPELAAQAHHFRDFEILVVDDGSRDRSVELLQSLSTRFPLQVLTHPKNLGLGAAVRRGFDAARMEWITYLPADGQVPAEDVQRFLPYMSTHDVIIGRRGAHPDYGLYRRLASRVYTTWVALAFGLRVRDFNWVQAWRRSLWERYPSTSTGVFISGEFLVKSRIACPRLVEIEIGYRPRSGGRAKNGSLRAAWRASRDILRLFWEECWAGRWHFLHPITPERPPDVGLSTRRAA